MSLKHQILLATALALGVATQAHSASVSASSNVEGGFNGTTWELGNNLASSTSAFAGTCFSAPGFGFDDADITQGSDAYDAGWTTYVNGVPYVAPEGIVDLTGSTLTAPPVAIGGLNVSVQHYYSATSSVARILLTMTNATGGAIATTVQVPVNFGSDGSTVYRLTSSGDAAVTTADRWIVSSDSTPSDPVNTSVFYGPGAAVVPTSYTTSVCSSSGSEGVGATFNLSIPAGGTRSLMFFAGLGNITTAGNSLASAQAAAQLFNTTAGMPPDWIASLSPTQRGQIANWSFGASFTSCLTSGLTNQLQIGACKRICEGPTLSTADRNYLINLYYQTFKSYPPCLQAPPQNNT